MRLIDADEITATLEIAISMMENTKSIIGVENLPVIDVEIKAYTDILKGIKEQPTVQPVATDINVGGTISRQAAVELVMKYCPDDDGAVQCDGDIRELLDELENLPSAQPETAKRIVGKSRDGMTLWYQCDMCDEPVDEQDNYCRGCGRRLIDG